ncbi:hypothetical protein M9Y10_036740 [Tritrichomonas musculus]|uniref:Uncharacterized protein n=1 Tax=Tritrichomonas musculus TaxID=1915356 RepID=A0ABR2GTN3_9EUKA
MSKSIFQIDVSNSEYEPEEEDLIKIILENDDIIYVNFSNLIHKSKYIREKYKYSEALNSIQDEIDEIKNRLKISPVSLKLFMQLIQQEKINIQIDHYKDFYILSEYFYIPKFTRELDNIGINELFNDLDNTIQILLDSKSVDNEFETKLTDKIEKILATQINECFEHPKFSELPVSSIYRIIERSSEENVDINLLVDFILKSSTTFFTLFKFVDFQRLTEDKIECLFNFINEQQEDTRKMYLDQFPSNFLFIQQMKHNYDQLLKETAQTKEEFRRAKEELERSQEELSKVKGELLQTRAESNRLKSEMKQYSKTVLIGGYDKYNQFGENPNNKNKNGYPIINPPLILSFDHSSHLSYSVYGWHSVLVTSGGSMQGTGYNGDNRISTSLPKTGINQFTDFSIKDGRGRQFAPVSAVCCGGATLYMFSNSSGINKQLVLCDCNINGGEPVFLDIGNQQPVALFGGFSNAAAITSDGRVIFINRQSVRKSPESRIDAVSLPDDEKASFVACCEESVVVLSSNGRVFSSSVANLRFATVSELEDEEIICVSGTYKHFLAANKEGRVFGRGSNEFGKLGIGKGKMCLSSFTEISSLDGHKIRSAYAGCGHSLFVTRDGKILSCGTNQYGQLLLSSGPSKDVYSPTETTITGGATFCIAGDCLSAVFIGSVPPPNTPNMRILQ